MARRDDRHSNCLIGCLAQLLSSFQLYHYACLLLQFLKVCKSHQKCESGVNSSLQLQGENSVQVGRVV